MKHFIRIPVKVCDASYLLTAKTLMDETHTTATSEDLHSSNTFSLKYTQNIQQCLRNMGNVSLNDVRNILLKH